MFEATHPVRRRASRDRPERFVRWAKKIGPNTAELIRTVLGSRRHPQQAFRSCLRILRLGNSYGEERLEAAAAKALAIGAHSFRSVDSILAHRLDENPPEQIELGAAAEHDNIRNADILVMPRGPSIAAAARIPHHSISA